MLNLAQILHSGRMLYPNAVAVHYGGHHLTYERLFHDIERIACHLLEAGVRPGALVGVEVQRPLSHWVVLLALMRLGARSVSLTDRFKAEFSALRDLSAIITNREAARAPLPYVRTIQVQPAWLQQEPAASVQSLPSPFAAAETLGRICFTSGTSGRPKAIEICSKRLHARLSGTAQRGRINSRSVLWCGLGVDVAYGFTAPVAAWLEGAAVVLSNGGKGAYSYLSARQVNLILASPAGLVPLLRDAREGSLPPLDASLIVAGGRLSVAQRDELLRDLCNEVLVAYGASEVGGVTLGDASGLDRHLGHVGTVFPDVEAMVVDEAGNQVPADTIGRLVVRSDSAAIEYLDNPVETKTHFLHGWFSSGDFAKLSKDRELTITGRSSDSFNFGGVKVSALDIDEIVRGHEGIVDVCTVALPDDRLVVVIVGQLRDAQVLAASIRAEFSMLPNFQLILVPSIQRGSMGKVNRSAFAEVIKAAMDSPPNGLLAGNVKVIGTF